MQLEAEMPQPRGQHPFSVKGQVVNIVGSVSYEVSVL